jgi:hypothetical protein
MVIGAVLWVLLGVTILGLYNGLMLLDDKTDENSEKNSQLETDWHIVGAALFLYLALTFWYTIGIQYALLAISGFWILFAGIVHKVGLNKPFFFVGTTAKTDKLLRKWFPKNPYKASAILKISLFIATLIIIIIKK